MKIENSSLSVNLFLSFFSSIDNRFSNFSGVFARAFSRSSALKLDFYEKFAGFQGKHKFYGFY